MDIFMRFLAIAVVCSLIGFALYDKAPRWLTTLIGIAASTVITYLWRHLIR